MKRIIIISSLVLLGVIIFGCLSVISDIRLVDKCSGYRSVRFGMDVTRATAMARKDGMLIKNPNYTALPDVTRDIFVYDYIVEFTRGQFLIIKEATRRKKIKNLLDKRYSMCYT